MPVRRDPRYHLWAAMLQRCRNPKNRQFKDYGGRGLAVSERWLTFTNFAADMGERPEGATLERRDNDLGYSADNCRWASRQEQNSNRRNCIYVDSDGERVKEERSEKPDYVLYPAEGVEKTFRRLLQFPEEDDRVCFPEILLDEDGAGVRCAQVLRENGTIKLIDAPDAPREKMFHYGLEVEPVLPFNTFT